MKMDIKDVVDVPDINMVPKPLPERTVAALKTLGMGYNLKYFLCFGFEGVPVEQLEKFHITLIYLGPINGVGWKSKQPYTWDLKFLNKIIEVYTRTFKNPEVFKFASFDEEAMFGRNNDIRVLLPNHTKFYVESCFHKTLFDIISASFSQTQESQFPFRPHLSTDLPHFQGRINKLYLCSQGYEVHKEWDV